MPITIVPGDLTKERLEADYLREKGAGQNIVYLATTSTRFDRAPCGPALKWPYEYSCRPY